MRIELLTGYKTINNTRHSQLEAFIFCRCKDCKKLTIFVRKILKNYFYNEIYILYFYFDVLTYSM